MILFSITIILLFFVSLYLEKYKGMNDTSWVANLVWDFPRTTRDMKMFLSLAAVLIAWVELERFSWSYVLVMFALGWLAFTAFVVGLIGAYTVFSKIFQFSSYKIRRWVENRKRDTIDWYYHELLVDTTDVVLSMVVKVACVGIVGAFLINLIMRTMVLW
jgi:hypothetical protein